MREPTKEHERPRRRQWLKRLGWAGFLFFLIKGLIWLAVFLGVGTWLLG
ncbi:MAG: hypothetical protein H6594_10990 [Flavobacteriales bacterium]|nr:hypothetical protein [Flavobacteriales bacterium]